MSQPPEEQKDDLGELLRRIREPERPATPPERPAASNQNVPPPGARWEGPPPPPGARWEGPPPPPGARWEGPPPNYQPPPRSVNPQGNWFQRSLREAPASTILLAVNIAIYLLTGLLSGFDLVNPASAVLQLGWKQNDLIAQGEYWRLISAMFLHGNLIHIAFNGYALYALGPTSEQLYGTRRFLAIYFLAGLWGSLASYAFNVSPAVGASGAIFGLFGALGLFFYLNRETFGEMGRQQLQGIVTMLAINLLIGFTAGGVIDNFAHLGGLLGGALSGWLLAPRLRRQPGFGALFQPNIQSTTLAWGWQALAIIALLSGIAAIVIRPPL